MEARVVLGRRLPGTFAGFQWSGAEPEGMYLVELGRRRSRPAGASSPSSGLRRVRGELMRPVMLAIVGDSAACNYMDILAQNLRLLATGEPALKPVYQHHDGTFGAPEYVVARRFMVIEGLLALHTRRMRDAFAVRVYLDPPEDLRRGWKVKRDCAKRGYAPAQVLAELER